MRRCPRLRLGAMTRIQIAQDPTADAVLSGDPFALVVGMLLDQQFPMERAFAGPAKVLERFGTLDPESLQKVRDVKKQAKIAAKAASAP